MPSYHNLEHSALPTHSKLVLITTFESDKIFPVSHSYFYELSIRLPTSFSTLVGSPVFLMTLSHEIIKFKINASNCFTSFPEFYANPTLHRPQVILPIARTSHNMRIYTTIKTVCFLNHLKKKRLPRSQSTKTGVPG